MFYVLFKTLLILTACGFLITNLSVYGEERAEQSRTSMQTNQYEWASFFPAVANGTRSQPVESGGDSKIYTIHLQAYSRNLTMVLKEVGISEYDDVEVTVVHKNSTEKFKVSESIHYYRGSVSELPNSRAHGILRRNDLFEGIIEMDSETYFVESPMRFFGDSSLIKSSKEQANRAIVYRWEDLRQFPIESACAQNDPSCYYYQTILHYKALFPPAEETKDSIISSRASRKNSTEAKNCFIQVVADHRFFQSVGYSSIQKTLEAVVWHIEEADHLFRSIKWNATKAPDRVGVALKSVTIFTTANSLGNVFKEDDTSDEIFLKRFKGFDTSQACVAMVFTFSPLQGTFGISYVGTVCNPRFNWALVNFRNMDGQVRQRAASVITTMHEIAHVFGANHDLVESSPKDCVPAGSPNDGKNGGNFIMYPTSAMGMHKNNRLFSQCSLDSIGKNLENVVKTRCMASVKPTPG